MKKALVLVGMAIIGGASAQTFTSTGGPYAIPDNSVAGINATVLVTGSVGALQSVTFTNLTHTWIGDLTFTLTDSASHSVIIMQRVGSATATGFGSSSDLAGNYTFAVGAGSIWTAAAATPVPAGTYRPSSNLFTGTVATSENPTNYTALTGGAGTWTLNAADAAGGDTGAFDSVSLNFAATPEPASMAVLGLGVVAFLRRRRKA